MRIRLNSFVRTNLLTILTVSGVILGIVLGIVLRETTEKWTPREVSYLNFIGDLFLRMLKALILPLIISSLISAIGSLDLSLSGKIGGRAVFYYITTTVVAVILGIILVSVIKPGADADGENLSGADSKSPRNLTTADTLMDLVRNMFPPNVVQACTQQYQTVLVPPPENPSETDILKWKLTEQYTDGMNILGLVVASCFFGIALGTLRQETPNLLKVCVEMSQIMMKITGWIIWISPIGVLFLISAKLLEMDDLGAIFGKLGLYFVTVAAGIIFHGFVILPTIYFIFTRKNPATFIANMGQAIATAFGTSSSSATLPVTIRCLEEKNGIDPRVARFVLPIGATINMDGTALYEAVAAIFIAQIRGIDLTLGNIVAISITATAASIGAAGIPQAGLVTMVMVLDTIGLPAEDVSLILAVDWLLDRVRTVVNVMGDSYGAAIVAHLSREELNSDAKKNSVVSVQSIENGPSEIKGMSDEAYNMTNGGVQLNERL